MGGWGFFKNMLMKSTNIWSSKCLTMIVSKYTINLQIPIILRYVSSFAYGLHVTCDLAFCNMPDMFTSLIWIDALSIQFD